jgi:LysM repeat protein
MKSATLRQISMKSALLLFICASPVLSAQTRVTLSREDIPHIPTDTLPTDRAEVRIVTFSDGTYRYIPTNPWHFMDAPAYASHWDTLNLFAYRTVPLADLPSTIEVELLDVHGFHAPARGEVMSRYGRRSGRDHNGVDVRVEHGQPIYAAFDGVVRFSRWNSGGFGNLVVVRHPSGLETYYAHLSRRAVAADDWVRAGQVIGYGGRTGRASALHLHFEVRYADQSFDPERLVDFERGELRRGMFALRKEYFNIRSRATEGIEGDDYAETLDGDDPVAADSLGLKAGGETDLAQVADADSLGLKAGGEPVLAQATGAQNAPPNAATETETAEPPQAAEPAEPEPVYHKIVSGDTLLALALHYDTSVAKICELNGITRTATLRLGRNLRIK